MDEVAPFYTLNSPRFGGRRPLPRFNISWSDSESLTLELATLGKMNMVGVPLTTPCPRTCPFGFRKLKPVFFSWGKSNQKTSFAPKGGPGITDTPV